MSETTTTHVEMETVLEAADIPEDASIHHMEWFPSGLEIDWGVEK